MGWALIVSLIVLLEVVVEIVGTRHREALLEHEGWEAAAGLLQQTFELPDNVSRWVDIFARSDPVPSGSLLPWKTAPDGILPVIRDREPGFVSHGSHELLEQFRAVRATRR